MLVPAIQNEVINRLGPGPRTTAADLLVAIDEAQKRIYNKLIKVKENLFYTSVLWNAQDGESEYTPADGVPTNIKRPLKVETRYADQDRRYPCHELRLVNISKMDEITTLYRSKNDPRYYRYGSGVNTVIGILPAHDVAGTNYTKMWYLQYPTEINDPAVALIIPEDSHYLVLEFTLAVAQLIEDQDMNGYLLLLKRFDQDVEEWIESEYPTSSEPRFTEDVEDSE